MKKLFAVSVLLTTMLFANSAFAACDGDAARQRGLKLRGILQALVEKDPDTYEPIGKEIQTKGREMRKAADDTQYYEDLCKYYDEQIGKFEKKK